MTKLMRSILPLSSWVHGIAVDSAAEISALPLDQMKAPALIVSAEDDLFKTLPGSRYTAQHIPTSEPTSELRVLQSGGHLMVGQGQTVQRLVGEFLERARRSESNVGRELQPT